MKKLFKIFAYLIVTVITLVVVLTVTAKLAENKITDIALKKVSESIDAPVIINKVSFNLLRKFPFATIELNDVYLGSPKQFQDSSSMLSNMDTIINIGKIYVSVKSKPLLKGNIEIMKIDIDGAYINYMVDTSGASNIDFLMDTTETAEDTIPTEPLNLILTDLSIKNIVCNFNDSFLKAKARIIIPELKVKAKLDGENISASVKGLLNITNASFEETNVHLMKQTNIDFDFDFETDSLSIKQLLINTDGANLNVLGSIILGDAIKTDLQFQGSDLVLDELIKYAPKEMLEEYGLEKISGQMNLDATIKGTYAEMDFPLVDLNVDFQNGRVLTSEYPELKNISFKGNITNGVLRNNQSTQVDFSTFHFETEQSKFDVIFSILDIDNIKYNVKTQMDINVGEFNGFIPDSTIEHIDGRVQASFSTKGELPDSIGDDFVDYVMANSTAHIKLSNFNIDVDEMLSIKNFSVGFNYKPNNFSLSNLNINIPAYNFDLQNTSLNTDFYGSINNTSELSLNIKSYHIETKGAEISGFLKLKNLDKPSYETETRIALNLEETKSMLPDSLLTALSGNIIIDIKSEATLNLDSIADQAIDAAFNKSIVNVEMNNITAILTNDELYKIENLSGVINMSPEVLKINKIRGIVAGLSFEIDSTEVRNSYETFVQGSKKEIFTVQTNITLGEINNSLLGAFMQSDTTSEEIPSQESKEESVNNENIELTDTSSTKYLLPDLSTFGLPHFLIRGKLAVNKLEYEKNVIDDISLKFRFTDSLYVIDQFKLTTCGGQMNSSVKIDARRWDKPVVDVKTIINSLDVKQLLLVNDSFGDTSLTHENISGLFTSELHLRAFYVDGLWPTEKIRAKGIFTIEDGRIYGYEPLVELSNNKIVGGLKELDKLEFNTLNTSFFMYKDKVYIPKTDVVSSSMDLSIFAMHSLQDDYEYHLKIHLGDVLTGKSDKLMKDQAKQNKKDGSTEERNGIRLVSLKLEKEKKNGFDNDKLEKNFKNKLNKQQGWLNLLFNPMLVNFSTDLDRTLRNKEILEKYGDKSNGN